MSDHPIRVGVVGAGGNTRGRHIPNLQAIPGVEVVSVCNRSRESGTRVAAELGIPTVYDKWYELVAADDTDAIVIGTWPYMHNPVTLAALAAGKHVMVEARMAMTEAEAREMLAASRECPDYVTQVVPSPFTLEVDATVRRLVDAGYLGDVVAVECRGAAGTFADFAAPMSWRQDVELSGHNIMSLGIWYEALMRWVGEATRVYAAGRTVVKRRHDDRTGGPRACLIPDHLDVIADLACGAQAHFLVSGVTGGLAENGFWLFGTAGTLRIVGGKLYGMKRDDENLCEIDIPAGERGGWRVEDEFVGAIRGGETIKLTDFATGVRYMAFTSAVHASLAEGLPVAVDNVV